MPVRRLSGHSRRVRRRWSEVLLTVVDGDSPEIPKLRWWDRRVVIDRFNELFEMLKGDVQMHMRWLMFAGRLDKVILRMLEMRSPRDYVTAIEAAGRLRLRPAIGPVSGYIDDPRPEVAMLAAQALVRIDPALGVRRVVNEFVHRPDWDVHRMASVLADGRSEIRVALAEAVRHADVDTRPRVIELIEALRDEAGGRAVRDLLTYQASHDRASHEEIAAAMRALSTFGDPRDAALVRRYTEHEDEGVRSEAELALKRIGSPVE
jgi:HEAT repeat protein